MRKLWVLLAMWAGWVVVPVIAGVEAVNATAFEGQSVPFVLSPTVLSDLHADTESGIRGEAGLITLVIPVPGGDGAGANGNAGAELRLVLDRVETLGGGRRAWTGRVGEAGAVTLVVDARGYVAAAVRPGDGRVIELRPGRRPGEVRIRALDVAALATCPGGLAFDGGGGELGPPSSGRRRAAARGRGPLHARPGAAVPHSPGGRGHGAVSAGEGYTCDDGSQIDVMVLYTTQARVAAGGTSQIEALIDLALADTNAAFGRSGVTTSVALVHSEEITYAETGDWTIDGPRLLDPNDGYLDEAHTLRNVYGADCVSVWVDSFNTGGIGYYPSGSLTDGGFSMLRLDNAALLTMAHEFGHNLFCAHQRPYDTPWADYSYGYVEPGGQWHTIMAVDAGSTGIPYYANPNVNWPGPTPGDPGPTGVAEGNPNPSNIARTINETSLFVANFRPTAAPGVSSVLRVDASASPGGDGASWATAFSDLKAAICVAAGSNGTVTDIWVRAGTYTPDGGGGGRAAHFDLVDGVQILGGFAGGETSADQRDPNTNVTILSGEIGSTGTSADNSYHIVEGSGRSASAVLDGFTISGAFADDDPNDGGGGIRVYGGGDPTIRHCIVEDNAASRGAGVYCAYGASPTLEDCTLQYNTALDPNWPSGGAGLHCRTASPTLRRCTIRANTARLGAGVANFYGASPTLEDCTLAENDGGADGEGGGMYNYSLCNPTLTRCTFDNNNAHFGMGLAAYYSCNPLLTHCAFVNHDRPADGEGGGMYVWATCAPELTNCVFADNQTAYGAGLEALFASAPRLVGCTFRNNSATGDSAGVSTYSTSNAVLINCLFTGNSAPYGGAIGNSVSSQASLINCTIVGNTATAAGAGIYNYESDPNVSNCILWDNRVSGVADEAAQIDGFNTTPMLRDNTMEGWTGALGGIGNDGADPLLRDADGADNTYGTSDDDARLSSGSPAIDHGTDAYVPGGITLDLLGRPRFLGLRVDRGAYEFGVTLGDIDQDGASDADDLAVLLACMNGPDQPPLAVSPYLAADCLEAFDHDSDGDVDMGDLAEFQAAFP